MKKHSIDFLLCAAFSFVALFCVSSSVAAQADVLQDKTKTFTKTGDAMPSFAVTTLDGEKINPADSKGKVVYVNFWATWCPPCRAEMPRMEREVWQKYKSDARFVMVAVAREQTEDEISGFVKNAGYTFPVAADPQRATYKLFASEGIPRSYVVGADGKIVFQSVGYNAGEFDKLNSTIAAELKKAQKTEAKTNK